MPKTIRQTVTLPARAARLYAMYLDPKAHAAITGAPVKISRRPGSPFSAFHGAISGKTLVAVPGKLIVQSWRSSHFKKSDLDSILVLTFSSAGRRGRIKLVHVNVADRDADGVRRGWKAYYWMPWRRHLSGK
jgi:activator of HSP90 ATPase